MSIQSRMSIHGHAPECHVTVGFFFLKLHGESNVKVKPFRANLFSGLVILNPIYTYTDSEQNCASASNDHPLKMTASSLRSGFVLDVNYLVGCQTMDCCIRPKMLRNDVRKHLLNQKYTS